MESKHNKGFTLVELMVTLAVGILLLTVGIPAFDSLSKNNARTGRVNALVGAIQLARSEAVKRGIPVAVCRRASANADQCAAPAGCAANHDNCWEEGWAVYADDGAIANAWDAADTVLRVETMENVQYTLTPAAAAYADEVTFAADGSATAASSFTYQDDDASIQPRVIDVSSTGRPSIR